MTKIWQKLKKSHVQLISRAAFVYPNLSLELFLNNNILQLQYFTTDLH